MPDIDSMPPDDVKFLREQGWTDAEITAAQEAPHDNSMGQMSGTQAAEATLKAHAGGILGGGAGAIGGGILTGALMGSEVPIIGNIIGGVAGGLAAGYGGQKLQTSLQSDQTNQAQALAAQQAEEQHPYISGATDLAASALASGGLPSVRTAVSGVKGIAGRLIGKPLTDDAKNVLLQASLNPAITTGMSLAQGQGIPSFGDLAGQAAGGALFAKTWLPGGRVKVQGEPNPEINNKADGTETTDSLTQAPGEMETPYIARDEDGQYKLGNKSIKKIFLDRMAQPIPKDSDDITQGYIRTQNEKLRALSPSVMRQQLHQNELIKTTQPENLEDADYQGGQMPEVSNNWNQTPQESVARARATTQDILPNAEVNTEANVPVPQEQVQPKSQTVSPNTLRITKDSLLPSNIGRLEKVPSQRVEGELEEKAENAPTLDHHKDAAELAEEQYLSKGNVNSPPQDNTVPYGQWISPEGTMHPVVNEAGHEAFARDVLNKRYGIDKTAIYKTPGSAIRQLQDKGWLRGAMFRPNATLETESSPEQVINEKQKGALKSWGIENNRGVTHYNGGDIHREHKIHEVANINSPLSDYNRYNEVQKQMAQAEFGSPEYTKLWKENEEIKNRNGGMPPKQFPEDNVRMPVSLQAHIMNGKATTGSVLHGLATTQGHPFQELAHELLNASDTKSLNVPWQHDASLDISNEWRSHYDPNDDVVRMGSGASGEARVVMEEAVHSLTSKKIPHFAGQGAEHYNRLQTYLKNGKNESVKDLIKSYLKVANHLGIEKELFEDKQGNQESAKFYHDSANKLYEQTQHLYAEFTTKFPDANIYVYDKLTPEQKILADRIHASSEQADLWRKKAERYGAPIRGLAGNADKLVQSSINAGRSTKYAMGNLDEFLAQAMKDHNFQRVLEGIKDTDSRTVWQTIVQAVKNLLGLDAKKGTMLERVLRTGGELVNQERPEDGVALINRYTKKNDSLLESLKDKLSDRSYFKETHTLDKYNEPYSNLKGEFYGGRAWTGPGNVDVTLHENIHRFFTENRDKYLPSIANKLNSGELNYADLSEVARLFNTLGYKRDSSKIFEGLSLMKKGEVTPDFVKKYFSIPLEESVGQLFNTIRRPLGPSGHEILNNIVTKSFGHDMADFVSSHITQEQYYPKWDGKKFYKIPEELPKDKYMGKFGSITRAVIDKIHDIGSPIAHKIADHMKMALNKEDELKGKWKNAVVQAGEKLTAIQKQRIMAAFNHELATKTPGTLLLKSQAERNFYNVARAKLSESGDYRLKIGEPVYQGGQPRSLKKDPLYFPGMANQKVEQVYRDNTDPAAIANLDTKFNEYNTKTLGLTPEASKERIDNFKKALQGSTNKSDMSHQDWFNAHRKAAGTPLPPEFREQDPVRNLERYFDRAAKDAAHYEYLEKDHGIMSALGQTKDAWNRDITPHSDGSLANNQAVKAGLHQWKGEPHSPVEGNEQSIAGLASAAFISGPPLEVHKNVSNIVKSLTQTANPVMMAKAIAHGLSSINQGYQHAVDNGVVKLTARSASQMVSASATAAEKMQSLATVIRKISTLGGLTTKVGTGLVQSMNEVIIPSKVERANAGNVTEQKFIRNLDPTYTRGKQYTPEEMNMLASRSASYIHGTGDIRSMPAWMLNDSEFSGFFSLAHWSIAQTNNFMKDVYEPALRGDVAPLMVGMFGAAVGGYLIKELRQDIQGKKSPIPSLSEIANSDRGVEGNKGLVAYNMIAAMQYSGFGGLLSQVAKYPFDFAYKNIPQGATFPLDEVASDLGKTLHEVSVTLANDPNVNWVDLAKTVTMHLLSTNIQLARIGINQGINHGLITGLPAEKKDLSDRLGQLRRFDMVSGLPYNEQDEASNPYMNLEQKKFKMETDPQKAIAQLPDLISNIMKTYGDRPDVMMSKLQSLKQNSYATFPSLEKMPISAMKYIAYLQREEGPQAAQEELQNYVGHKIVSEIKASAVP